MCMCSPSLWFGMCMCVCLSAFSCVSLLASSFAFGSLSLLFLQLLFLFCFPLQPCYTSSPLSMLLALILLLLLSSRLTSPLTVLPQTLPPLLPPLYYTPPRTAHEQQNLLSPPVLHAPEPLPIECDWPPPTSLGGSFLLLLPSLLLLASLLRHVSLLRLHFLSRRLLSLLLLLFPSLGLDRSAAAWRGAGSRP